MSTPQSQSILFSNHVGSTPKSLLKFNAPRFSLSRHLKLLKVKAILDGTHLVIVGTNTTFIGNTKCTILILNLQRECVSTFSVDSRIYKDINLFVGHSVQTFINYYKDNSPCLSSPLDFKIMLESEKSKSINKLSSITELAPSPKKSLFSNLFSILN
jgi:hypothetical protein